MDGYKVLAVGSVRIGKLNQLRPVGFAAPEIAKTPCIPTQISFLVGCPVHPRDVAIGFENLLSIVQETDPTLPVTINAEPRQSDLELTSVLTEYLCSHK
jgi:hypothetical protein